MAKDIKSKKITSKPKAVKQPRNKYFTHVEPKLMLIEAWARDGVIDEQIASNLGIAYSTFRVYRDKYEALSAALKNSKEVADAKVESKLFLNTQGQVVKIKKPIKVQKKYYNEENGKLSRIEEEIVYVDEEQYIPPHFGAQTFWLINRSNGKWKNTQIRYEEEGNKETNEILKSIASQLSSNPKINDDDLADLGD